MITNIINEQNRRLEKHNILNQKSSLESKKQTISIRGTQSPTTRSRIRTIGDTGIVLQKSETPTKPLKTLQM